MTASILVTPAALREPTIIDVSGRILRSMTARSVAFWVPMVAVFAAIAVGTAVFGEITGSIWNGARWVPQYFLLSIGASLTANLLRVHVAHGVTRRRFVVAGVIVAVVLSAGYALVMELVFVIERIVLSANDITQFSGTPDLAASPGTVVEGVLSFTLIYSGYFFAGWFIASGYQCFRSLTASLLIIPVAVPPLVLEAVQWGGGPLPQLTGLADITPLGDPGWIGFGIAGVLATVVALVMMLRSVPLNHGTAAGR